MEIYIVTTVHAEPEDKSLLSQVAVFTDEDEARRHFAAQRLCYIEMLRQEDDDADEETRDVSVRDFDDMSVGVCHDDGEMYQVRLVRKSLQQP